MKPKDFLRQLRYRLPTFRREWRINSHDDDSVKEVLRDKRTHVLATCMAAYPTTPSKQLAEEFGIDRQLIDQLAKMYGITKSKETRSEINRQNAMKCKNPFGGRSNYGANKREVEKVTKRGKVVATYESIKAAAAANKTAVSNIGKRCRGVIHSPLKGYNYRYKKNK